jgi:hypothetical protein
MLFLFLSLLSWNLSMSQTPGALDQQARQLEKATCPKSVRQVLEQQRIRPDGIPNDELKYCAYLIRMHQTDASDIVAITTTANGVSFREPMYVFARARKPDATLGAWRGGRFMPPDESMAQGAQRVEGKHQRRIRDYGSALVETDPPCFGQNLEQPSQQGEFIYFSSHASPSAACINVFRFANDQLQWWDGFYSLYQTPIKNGNLLHTGGMVHFAPTHPMKLFWYQPLKRAHELVYPKMPDAKLRRAFARQLAADYKKIPFEQQMQRNHPFDAQEMTQDVIVLSCSAIEDAALLAVTLENDAPTEWGQYTHLSLIVVITQISDAKKSRWADMRALDFDRHFGASAQKVPPTRALIDRFFQLAR